MQGGERFGYGLVGNRMLEAHLRRHAAGEIHAILDAAPPHAHADGQHHQQGRQRAYVLDALQEGEMGEIAGKGAQFHGAVHVEASAVRAFHPRVEGDAAEEDGREHGGDDSERQRDREATHRPGAELVENGRHDDGGQVRVDDGQVGPLETGPDSLHGPQAEGEFLADALEDEHVGVHGHADGQHNARDARQGQCGPERGHAAHEQGQGAQEHSVGEHPGPAVAQGHDDHDRQRADEGGEDAAGDGSLPEGGAHRALFEHVDGRGEGAGTQGDGEVLRLFRGELAADAGRAPGDFFLNLGRAVDGAVNHDGQPLADVFARGRFKERGPARREGEADDGAVLVVETRTGIGHVLAAEERRGVKGQPHTALRAFLALHGVVGHAGRQVALRHVVAYEVEGKIGGPFDELHGPVDVGQTGKLDQDAVALLLADVGFGHAELVDAAGNGAQDLIHGQFAGLFDVGGGKGIRHAHRPVRAGERRTGDDLRGVLMDEGEEGVELAGPGEDEFLPPGGAARADDGDPGLARLLAQPLAAVDQRGADGLVRVHAEGELDPAFQVKAQIDPRCARYGHALRQERRCQQKEGESHDDSGNRITIRKFHESLSHGCGSGRLRRENPAQDAR